MPAFQKDFGGAWVVMFVAQCDSEVTWYTVQIDKCDTWSKGHHTAVSVISVLGILAATPHWQPYYAQLFNSILSLSGLLYCVSISRLLDTVSLWWHQLMTASTTAPLVNICWIIRAACHVNCYMTSDFCMVTVVSSAILTVKWLWIAFWVPGPTVLEFLLASENTAQDNEKKLKKKLLLNNDFLCFVGFLWLLLFIYLFF